MASLGPIFLSTTDETFLVEIASYFDILFKENFFEERMSPFNQLYEKKLDKTNSFSIRPGLEKSRCLESIDLN